MSSRQAGRERAPHRRAPDAPASDGLSKERLRVWLRLLACSTRIEQRVRSALRERYATTLPRFDLMAALYRAPNGLSMGELSRQLMVSNGNVTGVVDRLTREGLTERSALPNDRRTFVVVLTDRGRTVFAEMAVRHEGWIDTLLGALEPDELRSLSVLLSKARTSVEETVLP